MDATHCLVDVDHSFGPWAEACRGGFDFTLLFEETILALLPACALLLASPSCLLYLKSKTVKVKSSALLHVKLILWTFYVALHLVLLVFWTRPESQGTDFSIPVAALSLFCGISLFTISYFEHQRTIRPSTVIGTFLFVSLLCNCARTRTLWLRQSESAIPITMSLLTANTAILLVVENIEKRKILLLWNADEHTSEATAGIFNRYFFLWLNPLFRQGFTQTLTIEKLSSLDRPLTSKHLSRVLSKEWKLGVERSKSLQRVVFKTLRWPLLGVVVPRLALGALNFAQPFLINDAITLSNEPVSDATNNIGAGLIGAYIFVYVGIAVMTGQYWHNNYRAITMARGGLISLLYTKLSDLSVSTANATSSLTLMSADIERITNGWQTMHEIWANCIEIAVAIWLLERQLGASCAIPLGVAIASVIGLVFLTSLVVSRQAIWLQAIERRIEATTAMLNSMKGVKMCGLTDILMDKIQRLREQELQISSKFRQLLIWNMAFAYLTPIIAPVLTFAVFSVTARNANGQTTLDTARVFTSLSLFALLADPLASLMIAVVQFAGAAGSFQRIQGFLESEERRDERIIISSQESGESSSKTSTSLGSLPSRSDQEKVHLAETTKPDLGNIDIQDALKVRDASFGWSKEQPKVLSDISINIPCGKLMIIVGPVGCGKSTLLKGLLGEVPQSIGTVETISFEIAYCDQTNWHMNTTISESIIGVSSMDPAWYKAVIQACALDEDLKQLSKGDNTQIGSSGTALSGGQSQRIALARAVYANKRVVFLDDTLSGLDATTEQKVFNNLLGQNGLWKQSNTTVVLVSSSSKRLPHADLIVALSADGKIAEQGSFEELNSIGGETITAPQYRASSVEQKTESVVEELAGTPNSGDGDVKIYLYYIGSIGWIPCILFFFAISAYAIFYSFPSIWVQWWSAANILNPNGNLGYWLGIYGFLAAGALISLITSVWQMLIHIMPKSGEGLHRDLLQTVLHAPMSFFSSTDIGVTINRFSQDLQLIDMDLPLAALNTCVTLVLVLAQMIIIGVASIYAAISFPICLVVFYYIQKYYLKTSRQMRLLDLEAKSPLYSNFVECLNGLATIRAFGWQNALAEKNLGMLEKSQKPFYLFWAIQRWLTLVLDLVVAGIAVLLIILVVTLRGKISAGAIGVALYNVILFSQNIKLLLQFWTNLETHIGAVARIKTFTEETVPEDLPSEKRHPPDTWPSCGEISFKNVFASYRSSSLVLKDVSFTIKAGSKVAICGRTGSGKSSLCGSLFRMLDVCAGSITIDGLNLATMPRQTVRSRIIGVPQDSMLLPGDVRFNIDPVSLAVDESLIEALERVELWDIIEEKGGLDASIEDIFLTHGQKQLFCLARAMVRSSTVVVLDEATSSVDGKTDALMQRVIRQKFANHTIIAVAHKLETILDFDQIVLLDGGCVKEIGPPHELLANAESEFAKLYRDFSSEKRTEQI